MTKKSEKLKELVKSYWALQNDREDLKDDLDSVVTEIKQLLALKTGTLTEEEVKLFESKKIQVDDEFESIISLSARSNVKANWSYIEKKLSPQQMRYAKKTGATYTVFKISSRILKGT